MVINRNTYTQTPKIQWIPKEKPNWCEFWNGFRECYSCFCQMELFCFPGTKHFFRIQPQEKCKTPNQRNIFSCVCLTVICECFNSFEWNRIYQLNTIWINVWIAVFQCSQPFSPLQCHDLNIKVPLNPPGFKSMLSMHFILNLDYFSIYVAFWA